MNLVRSSGLGVEGFPIAVEKSPLLRVLVVDDEPLIRWSMAETLAHLGHTVTEAGNAKEALQRLTGGPAPDVILLDFRLPDSNDLTLLETIRRMVPDSSVIMMTAFGTPAILADALERGAFRVIGKPVEMQDLQNMVQEAHASRAR